MTHCEKCAKGEKTKTKKLKATCFVCHKVVEEVLDLHHTHATICSFECERTYWLQVALD